MKERQLKQLSSLQRNEITSALLYERLASVIRNSGNADLLREMAVTEMEHYQF